MISLLFLTHLVKLMMEKKSGVDEEFKSNPMKFSDGEISVGKNKQPEIVKRFICFCYLQNIGDFDIESGLVLFMLANELMQIKSKDDEEDQWVIFRKFMECD